MKPEHYLAIAVRLFAIVLFANTLRNSVALIELMLNGTSNGFDVPVPYAAASVALPFTVSIILWFFPLTISSKILTPEINHPIDPVSANQLLCVLILCIGVYTLFYAIIDSIYWATLWVMTKKIVLGSTPSNIGITNISNMVSTGFELVFSLLLIFKARFIACSLLNLSK